MYREPVGVPKVEGDVGHVEVVVGEEFLYDLSFVAQAYDEVVEAIVGVDLHYVPQYGLSAYLDHGLGLQVGFLAYPGPKASGQYDYFHGLPPYLLNPMPLIRVPTKKSIPNIRPFSPDRKDWASSKYPSYSSWDMEVMYL